MADNYNVILEASYINSVKPAELISKLKATNNEGASTAANGDMLMASGLSFMDAMDVEQSLSAKGLPVVVRKEGDMPKAAPTAAAAPAQEDLTKKDSYKVGGLELSLEDIGGENKPGAVGSLKPCPSCGFRQMVQLHCIKCGANMESA